MDQDTRFPNSQDQIWGRNEQPNYRHDFYNGASLHPASGTAADGRQLAMHAQQYQETRPDINYHALPMQVGSNHRVNLHQSQLDLSNFGAASNGFQQVMLNPQQENMTPFTSIENIPQPRHPNCYLPVIPAQHSVPQQPIGNQYPHRYDIPADSHHFRLPANIYECKWNISENKTGENVVCCDGRFLSIRELAIHIKNKHVRGYEHTDHTCYWRGCERNLKKFQAKYKLVNHIRVHTGEKPFRCPKPNCGKSFARSENLKIHMRVHTGEKPFECTFSGCRRSFGNSSDRKKHMRTHKKSKSFKCHFPNCDKAYTHAASLRKHLKDHTAEDLCDPQTPEFSDSNESLETLSGSSQAGSQIRSPTSFLLEMGGNQAAVQPNNSETGSQISSPTSFLLEMGGNQTAVQPNNSETGSQISSPTSFLLEMGGNQTAVPPNNSETGSQISSPTSFLLEMGENQTAVPPNNSETGSQVRSPTSFLLEMHENQTAVPPNIDMSRDLHAGTSSLAAPHTSEYTTVTDTESDLQRDLNMLSLSQSHGPRLAVNSLHPNNVGHCYSSPENTSGFGNVAEFMISGQGSHFQVSANHEVLRNFDHYTMNESSQRSQPWPTESTASLQSPVTLLNNPGQM